MTATLVDDEVHRAEKLVEAVRLATSNDAGDPDAILLDLAPHAPIAEVHRSFATIIEATLLLRALRPYMPDASECLLAIYDEAVARAVLAAVMLLCYDEPVAIDVDGVDAETERAA